MKLTGEKRSNGWMKAVTTLHEKETKVDHVQDGLGAVTVPKDYALTGTDIGFNIYPANVYFWAST
jgi:hypothetical protein